MQINRNSSFCGENSLYNPDESVYGRVISINAISWRLPVQVRWSTGFHNCYNTGDLVVVKTMGKPRKGFGKWVKALENGSEE